MTTRTIDAVISDVGRHYLRLQLTTDVGPIRVGNLVHHFGSPEAVLAASMSELQQVDGVGGKTAEAIFRARNDDAVDLEIARAVDCGLRILCVQDDDYPKPLLNITDPPICLYVRGTLEPADSVAIAIVGTRRCSHYGREQAIRFGEMLGAAGFTVVSGLARGIDSHAHRGAIQGGGRTIAVLGNGLGSIYPPEHETLASEIASAGAVVTEAPVDAAPDASNFPRRNRIIAGLALGVLVIEAGRRSGALITARLALDYNREVFAVPGRIDRPEQTAGVNSLIRDGRGKLVTDLEDLLDELADVGRIMGASPSEASATDRAESPPSASQQVKLDAQERAVLDAVENGEEEVEQISAATAFEPGRVVALLTNLQLRGLIQRLPGDRFVCRTKRTSGRSGPR